MRTTNILNAHDYYLKCARLLSFVVFFCEQSEPLFRGLFSRPHHSVGIFKT